MAIPVAVTSDAPTSAEIETARQYLEKTRDQICDCVQSLSEAQWTFKPSPDTWSVLDNVDHLGVVLTMARNLIDNAIDNPAIADRNVAELDALCVSRIVDRSARFKAPAVIQPVGNLTPAEAFQQFRDKFVPLLDMLTSGARLRRNVAPHPLVGPMDAYQWILCVAAHQERHFHQILELKADPNFPHN
jgi:hypothetical protein